VRLAALNLKVDLKGVDLGSLGQNQDSGDSRVHLNSCVLTFT